MINTTRLRVACLALRKASVSLVAALATIFLGGGAPATWAQTQANPEQGAPEITEVVITGSRIKVPANITATSPTAVVTGQDVKLQGYTDITDVVNQLPQNIIGANADFGNTSNPGTSTGGFTTVDLRGLGPQRTLVLVNGRRLGAGDPSTANQNVAPDIDQIPVALIERVDVVTGGASATYGSDAIAGVVNFVLKKDFEGVQIDAQYGFAQHHQHNGYVEGLLRVDDPNTGFSGQSFVPSGSIRDGYKHDVSILMGRNFDDNKGNFTGYFVYHEQQPVTAAARDFSSCQLVSNGDVASPTYSGVECLGSSNSNRFTPLGVAPGAKTEFTVVGNQLLPWPQAGSNPPAQFNYSPYQYLQREDKRFQAGFLAHDELSGQFKPYMELTWMDDRSVAVVAPSGIFVGGNPFTEDNNQLVNCSNPLLSAQQLAILCTPAQIAGDAANPGSKGNSADVSIGRRNVEGGGRASSYEHNNVRAVLGVNGDLVAGWSYDAYASYYYTTTFQQNAQYLDYTKVNDALQVTTNAQGQPACISGGTCVPYNIFTEGGVTSAALNYLQTPGTAYGNNTEQVAHVDITGELGQYGLKTPWANDAAAINLGYDHRKDTVTFHPDGAETSGVLAGFSGALVNIDEGYNINEAFFEARLPIAHDAPGVYDLTADAGYRYSDYNTSGATNTYKFEVQYAPIEDARLRFSFDHAIRAPNLIELFVAPSYGQENVVGVDPCAGKPTATLEQCERTGVTPAQYAVDPVTHSNSIIQCVSGQCGQVIEGNRNLKPEKATTWSLGLSVTPHLLPGFSASLDYYHIDLKDQIGNYPFATILNGCLTQNDPVYCSQIVRTPAGSLTGATVAGGGYFLQQDFNLGASVVSGFDLQMNYHHPLPDGWGLFSASMNGAYLWHQTFSPYPGAPTSDCAGLFGSTCSNGSVNPRWRHVLRLSWETPIGVLFSAQWRFIGPTTFDNNSQQPLLQGAEEGANGSNEPFPYYDAYNARIPGYSYLDLTAVWHALDHLEVRAGVNNLFDRDPPLIPSADISGNAGPANSFGAYDYLGRQIFVAFTAKF
jgi:iron complex outermembrane recepter protein